MLSVSVGPGTRQDRLRELADGGQGERAADQRLRPRSDLACDLAQDDGSGRIRVGDDDRCADVSALTYKRGMTREEVYRDQFG